jgi:cytochrome oxidase Cu insertion factor (SCO1/SenC/PrrC family)
MNKPERNAPAPAQRQPGFLSSKQAMVLLALIFLAPVFVAWVMHHAGEQGWRPKSTTNYGTLVQPARPLTVPADLVAGDRALGRYLQGLWTLVYAGDGKCAAACKQELYRMRQVRLAQNEDMKRVQTLYLLLGSSVPQAVSALTGKEYPDLRVVPVSPAQAAVLAPQFRVDDTQFGHNGYLYIVDPLGNLMMFYTPESNPSGMLKDLRKLLKASQIG